jgi:hypothetical protein
MDLLRPLRRGRIFGYREARIGSEGNFYKQIELVESYADNQ